MWKYHAFIGWSISNHGFIKILVTEYGSTASMEELMDSILTVDSEKLRELGQRYLNPETMSLVTAGAV